MRSCVRGIGTAVLSAEPSRTWLDEESRVSTMKDMSTVALGNLVSVSEAAEILADRGIVLNEDSIAIYCRRGENNGGLHAEKKFGRWLIRRDSVNRFVPPKPGNPNFSKKSS